MAGGDDYGVTSFERPAFDFDAKEPQGAAGAARRNVAGPPHPRAAASAVPQSDLGLKLALGGLVGLIVILLIALVVGIVMQVGGDEEEEADTSEQFE